uniref:Piwi domain-containing protein n=1 Tax=Steinernema glaseri TaxID=37863 RepID=A0A1I7Z5T1_9BILA
MMLGRDPAANDVHRLRRDLKGLFVETQHTRRRRVYPISNIVDETPETKKFTNADGVEVTLQQYFQQAYGITLVQPRSPLVVVSMGPRHIYYPMELVYIADGQRVSASQQTPKQIQTMIRQCAIPPGDRVRQISQLVRGLDIRTENKYLKAAEVGVTPQPLKARGRLLATPIIRYAQGATTMPDAKSNWKMARNQYFSPSTISDWALFIVVIKGRQNRFGEELVKNFQTMLVQECRSRGLTINPPSAWSYVEPVEDAIKCLFETAVSSKTPFLFFISHDDVTSVHNKIKYFERLFGVITQDLKMSTAIDVVQKGKRQTLENIVNKLNMKNGGQNYTVEIPKADHGKTDALPADRLVIGLSTSHAGPAPRTERPRTGPQQEHQSQVPSVIGVAANIKKDPLDFVGDCLYQQSRRDEKIGVLQPLIRTFINAFTENRGMPPRSIVLFRNGASEGQYKDIMDLELLMVRAVARSCGLEPKITLIVAQKMHNLRLMPQNINPQARPSDQNIAPGTVVDSQVIHPAYSEFYLNSHVALQGTARTPRYTVLHDDQKMSMDELENLTYGLSFAHQIVNLTTSLPAPIYIAMRYAERGMNTFVASSVDYTKNSGTPTRSPNGSVPQVPSSVPEGAFDFNRMMTDLSYANCSLGQFRVNA